MANIIKNYTLHGITASTETSLCPAVSSAGELVQSLRIANREASAIATITVKIKTSTTIDWQSIEYSISAGDESIIFDVFDKIILTDGQNITVESDQDEVDFILSTSIGLVTT